MELTPFDTFYRVAQLCSTCSPTVTLLVKAYKPHLEPLLSLPPPSRGDVFVGSVSNSVAANSGSEAAPVSPHGYPHDTLSQHRHGRESGVPSAAAVAAAAAAASVASSSAIAAATGSGREHSPLGFYSAPYGASAGGGKDKIGSGLARCGGGIGGGNGSVENGLPVGSGVAVVVSDSGGRFDAALGTGGGNGVLTTSSHGE